MSWKIGDGNPDGATGGALTGITVMEGCMSKPGAGRFGAVVSVAEGVRVGVGVGVATGGGVVMISGVGGVPMTVKFFTCAAWQISMTAW